MKYQASLEDVLIYLKKGNKPPPSFATLDQKTRRSRMHTLRSYAKGFTYDPADGCLYYNGGRKAAKLLQRIKVLFTKDEVTEVLSEMHNYESLGPHMGVKRTQSDIVQKFYWRSITEDIQQWIAGCPQCQNTVAKRKSVNVVPELYAHEPWDLVGVDLFGPLTETCRKNRYVVTATCLFSKWVEAEPIPEKSSECVFEFLTNLFYRWGLPRRFITEHRKEFNNQKLNELFYNKFGIRHNITVAYHPQSNGQDEKTNDLIRIHLSKIVNEKQTDWDKHLSEVCWSIRSSVNEVTKRTPFEAMYIRKPRLPTDLTEESAGDSVYISNDPPLSTVNEYLEMKSIHSSELH